MKIAIQRTKEGEGLDFPVYATEDSAGMDLLAAIEEELTLKPGERALIPAGFCLALPTGYEAQIRPRSGLALKYGLTLLNSPGTIDPDYRGQVKVIAINLGENSITIKRGDRIAQMIISQIEKIEWNEVENLPNSTRGSGGFGHSDNNNHRKKDDNST